MESAVFKWAQQADPFKEKKAEEKQPHKMVSANEVVMQHGVPRDAVLRYVQQELDEAANFCSLPGTLMFVISYAIVVVIHDDAVVIRAVENSIALDVEGNANFAYDSTYMAHKDIDSVNSFTDFYSWTRTGFLPLYLPQSYSVSEGKDPTNPQVAAFMRNYTMRERGTILNYDRIVGGIRFRQQREPAQKCVAGESLMNFYGEECYGDRHHALEPEMGMAYQRITKPSNVTWFYVHEETYMHQYRITMMEAANWLDPSTTKVEIAIPVYTGEFGLHTLVNVNFYFSRSGHIWKEVMPLSAFGEWYLKWYYILYDLVWFALLLSLLKTEVLEVLSYIRNSGNPAQALWEEYVNFWNVIDWVSIGSGIFIVVLALASFSGTDKCTKEALKVASVPTSDKEAYAKQVATYVDALEYTCFYVHTLRLVLSTYPLVIVIRLFKAFKAQPRLALVTNTLAVTYVDLLHFMLVFCSIFLTLCISGFVLFGRRVEMFETFPRSINTVFRLMLGDFDWDELRKTGYIDGFLWLALTLSVLNLLLLNMVLAIVMDGYAEAKKRSVSQDTLIQEIQMIIVNYYKERKGVWVPLRIVCEALKDVEAKWLYEERHRGLPKERRHLDGDPVEEKILLLGKHSKVAAGMRVVPVDADIAQFVGPGKVLIVGTGGLKVRVLHENSITREYDTGHDLNFELGLADGEDPLPFSEDDDTSLEKQVISAERLMKIVATYDKRFKMHLPQAVNLLEKTVLQYYKEHCEEVDWAELRKVVAKVEYREAKIKAMLHSPHNAAFMTSADEMRVLRHYSSEFYEAVRVDRQAALRDIVAHEAEIAVLQKRLLLAESQAMEKHKKKQADGTANAARPLALPAPGDFAVGGLIASSCTVVDLDSGAVPEAELQAEIQLRDFRRDRGDTAASETYVGSDAVGVDVTNIRKSRGVDVHGVELELLDIADIDDPDATTMGLDDELGITDAARLARSLLLESRLTGENLDHHHQRLGGMARESTGGSDEASSPSLGSLISLPRSEGANFTHV